MYDEASQNDQIPAEEKSLGDFFPLPKLCGEELPSTCAGGKYQVTSGIIVVRVNW